MEARPADETRAIDALRLEAEELRASRKRVAVTADAERRSIERALHDGVQQVLVGLAANLELASRSMDADPSSTKRLLDEMGLEVRQAMEETRKLALWIYPPLLEVGGLVAALRSAASSERVPIRIDVVLDPACPPEIVSTVYFCCLDVLERIGVGTPVAVTVRSEEGGLVFEVVADRGLNVEQPPLIDRVEALGGRMTIEQGPGAQTRVAGSLPLP